MFRKFIVIVAVGGMLSATLAGAQAPTAPTGRSGAAGPTTSHIPSRARGDPAAPDAPTTLGGQVLANLNKLEDDLRINAAQQKDWDAYATRVIRLADDISRARFAARDLEGTAITAPQLFERILETAQNRMTAIEEIVDAGRALYARLSVEQQKLADRRLALITLSLASGAPPPGPRGENATAGDRPKP